MNSSTSNFNEILWNLFIDCQTNEHFLRRFTENSLDEIEEQFYRILVEFHRTFSDEFLRSIPIDRLTSHRKVFKEIRQFIPSSDLHQHLNSIENLFSQFEEFSQNLIQRKSSSFEHFLLRTTKKVRKKKNKTIQRNLFSF